MQPTRQCYSMSRHLKFIPLKIHSWTFFLGWLRTGFFFYGSDSRQAGLHLISNAKCYRLMHDIIIIIILLSYYVLHNGKYNTGL